MSLVRTLGKIAVGIAVAKGVGKMSNRGGSAGAGGGLGGLLGSVLGGGGLGSALGGSGGLGGLLGGMLGGQQGSQQGSQQDIPQGTQQGRQSGGGMGDIGALLGGKAGGGMSGGLGGLLESFSGGASSASASASHVPSPAGGSLGDLLNSALQGNRIPEPEPAQEDLARVLIKAMVNAAKSDGTIDQAEHQKIVANLGDDVSEEERQFVLDEMKAPLDLDGLVKTVPRGAETQVYMMSLLGIDLDSREEAQYLDNLRKGMGLSEEQANSVHQKLGVPTLYN